MLLAGFFDLDNDYYSRNSPCRVHSSGIVLSNGGYFDPAYVCCRRLLSNSYYNYGCNAPIALNAQIQPISGVPALNISQLGFKFDGITNWKHSLCRCRIMMNGDGISIPQFQPKVRYFIMELSLQLLDLAYQPDFNGAIYFYLLVQ
jgi:hypothetical protein